MIGIGAALVLGFVAGHFGGSSIFGYQSFEECFLRETQKGRGGAAAINIAADYCETVVSETVVK